MLPKPISSSLETEWAYSGFGAS